MITSPRREYRLSRLMLGTVQFGMPYGVANRTGQPDYPLVLKIIEAAVEGGVNCFDTAAAYGTSEQVLGRALRELKIVDRVVVVTKVQTLSSEELADANLARASIEKSLATSRQRLGIDCLPVVLFHRESDAAYLDVLHEFKEKGWLKHAGVSCDNRPGAAEKFVADRSVSALQLPANIVDRRHQRTGVFHQASDAGIAVFIRSVYLQGLLVMPEQQIPPTLQAIGPVRRALQKIATEAGMSLAELALRYMLAQAGVTCVLAGVETLEQVRDNLAMFERGPLPGDMLAAIDAVVPELPQDVITPWRWPALSGS